MNIRESFSLKMIQHIAKACGAILVATIIVVFSLQHIQAISKSVQEQRRLIARLQSRTSHLSQLKEEAQAMGDSDKTILAAFPTSDNILDFVNTMEGLAKKHSLEQSLKFGGITSVPGAVGGQHLAFAEFSGVVVGRRLDEYAFLKEFERLSYFTGMSSLNMQGTGEKGWDDTVQMSFAGRVYIRNMTQ